MLCTLKDGRATQNGGPRALTRLMLARPRPPQQQLPATLPRPLPLAGSPPPTPTLTPRSGRGAARAAACVMYVCVSCTLCHPFTLPPAQPRADRAHGHTHKEKTH
ncbi:unnamed protein product [Eretmochelys imbricata]